METNILVLGGGRMGKIVAKDLAESYLITIADTAYPDRKFLLDHDMEFIQTDLSDYNTLCELAEEYDLIVGALPADLSYNAVKAAIASGTDMVDLSYMRQNPMHLHQAAHDNNVVVIVDTGVAPGLTNMIAGRVAEEQGYIDSGKLMVGGMAADKNAPYGYRLTWSPEDLLAEYTRPAQYISDSRIVSSPALSGIEEVVVSGVGVLEAFMTDGLRTLLNMEEARNLVEKTMRWPGHVDAVKPLIHQGTFIKEMKDKCSKGDDMVVLYCDIDGRKFQMVAYPRDGMTAMQRTTAITCAAFTKLLAECGSLPCGVITPEALGRDEGIYGFINDNLREYGLEIEERTDG